MAGEPVPGQLRGGLRGCRAPRTGGWRRARRPAGSRSAAAPAPRRLSSSTDVVVAADDEQGRGGARRQAGPGEVGAAAAGDDGGDVGAGLGGGPAAPRRRRCWRRSSRPAARPTSGWAAQPARSPSASRRAEQLDVEDVGAVELLVGVSRSNSSVPSPAWLQHAGDVAVAGAVPAAAAAVGEHDDPVSPLRHGQVAAEPAPSPAPTATSSSREPRSRLARSSGTAAAGRARPSRAQAGDHLVVGGLGEVGVELADAEERFWGVDADELVGGAGQIRAVQSRGATGHRQHDPGGACGAGHLAGGPGGRSGGDAVVDDHDHPAGRAGRELGPARNRPARGGRARPAPASRPRPAPRR